MRLLLDTHIALWAITDSARLPRRARDLIAEPGNTPFVSAVTVWEISIWHRIKPDEMPISGREALEWFDKAGYFPLKIDAVHVAGVDELPLHHADPFDRLLVSQALAEPLRLLTHDARLAAYSDTVIVV